MAPENAVLLAKTDRVSGYGDGWPLRMLAYLLTPLATDARSGSAFGEWNTPKVELRVAADTERMLSKSGRVVRECLIPSERFVELLGYLSRTVLGSERASIASGIVHARFVDEPTDRFFTAYVRRSAVLTPFFQLDQFARHL